MGVNEADVANIMGGMGQADGVKLNDSKGKLKNRFEICRKLGQGTYGKVQMGINKETGQEVAIKTIKKSKIETDADLVRIRREIQIMSSVHHPNIIHIYEVFENKEKMVLVMELAAGGELYDYLSERKCLEDREARRIFRQIATATYYCHKHNICHRDLKLENILLDETGAAKIADFGLSNVYDGKNLLGTFCGSPLYASPEIVKGCPYVGPEVDCWSLGVLLYTLVYGAMPFDGSNFKRLVKQITTGDYYEPKQPSSASDLIRSMLTVEAAKRATVSDICAHWWVNEGYDKNCLEEAEYLAGLTPVRLDLLLTLAPAAVAAEQPEATTGTAGAVVVTQQDEEENQQPASHVERPPSVCIEELPADGSGVDAAAKSKGSEEQMRVEEPQEETKSPGRKRKDKAKRKLVETPSMVEEKPVAKRRDGDPGSQPEIKEVPMDVDKPTSTGNAQAKPRQKESGAKKSIKAKEDLRTKKRDRSSTPRCRAPSPEERSPRVSAPPPQVPDHVRPVGAAGSSPPNSESSSLKSHEDGVVRPPVDSSADSGIVISEKPPSKEARPSRPERPKTASSAAAKNNARVTQQAGAESQPESSVRAKGISALSDKLQNASASDRHDVLGVASESHPSTAATTPSPPVSSDHDSSSTLKDSTDHTSKAHSDSPSMQQIKELPLDDPEGSKTPRQDAGQTLLTPKVSDAVSTKPADKDATDFLGLQTPSPEKLSVDVSGKPPISKDVVPQTAPPIVVISSPLTKEKTSDSVGSAVTLSSSNGSVPPEGRATAAQEEKDYKKAMEMAVAQRQAELMQKEKDSKVGRAAAYWNNFIGDVIAKSKPPENVKSLEKPKKIANAGVGSKGMNDLKNAFENPKPKKTHDEKLAIMRRNSKKLNLEGCTPGLRVNDAKSVFECKKEPTTPSILRRNSTNSQKWGKPKAQSEGEEESSSRLPFGQEDEMRTHEKVRAKLKTKPPSINQALVTPEASKDRPGVANDFAARLATDVVDGKKVPGETSQDHNAIDVAPAQAVVVDVKQVHEEPQVGLNEIRLNGNDATTIAVLTPEQKTIPEKEVVTSVSKKTDKSTVKNTTDDKKKPSKNELLKPASSKSTSKPSASPKPKLKFKKSAKKDAANSAKGSNVCTVSPQENGKGLVLSVRSQKPVDTKGQEVKANVSKGDKEKEKVANVVEAIGSDGAKVSSQEARVAAVGVISREVMKNRGSGVPKDTNSQSLPATPVKDAPKDAQATASAPTSPDIASLTSTMPEVATTPQVPGPPPSPPDSADPKLFVPKIKTITPDAKSGNKLEAVKSSLKKVPHAPAMKKKTDPDSPAETGGQFFSEEKKLEGESSRVEGNGVGQAQNMDAKLSLGPGNVLQDQQTGGIPKDMSETPKVPVEPASRTAAPEVDPRPAQGQEKERFIPITVEPPAIVSAGVTAGVDRVPRPFSPQSSPHEASLGKPPVASGSLGRKKKEHYIPITVEGRGTIVPTPTEDDEASERRDVFHPNSLSRQRWGSRKKRMGAAYSDSSMSDDENMGPYFNSPFGGLQRYSSMGKHGLNEERGAGWSAGGPYGGGAGGGGGGGAGMMFPMRKGRGAPFAMQRVESFSSEDGDDDFGDDDVYRELTAENLFSTLLSRVKSLTKRIHDEHDQHVAWQQTQRIMDHPLNPGGTHALLERNARRGSLKKRGIGVDPVGGAGGGTPMSFSRQSSLREDVAPRGHFDETPLLSPVGPPERRPYSRGGTLSRNNYGPVAPTADDFVIEGAPDQPLTFQQKKNLEKRRLKHLHRQFSEELQSIEQDILQASLDKLRKEAAERSTADAVSDAASDGYLSPAEDTESISSDIFGAPDCAGDDFASRQRQRNMQQLARLDENNELGHRHGFPRQPHHAQHTMMGAPPARSTKARPITRRSISRELFEERPVTKARPVARRSVSRELFDSGFAPPSVGGSAGGGGGGGARPRKDIPDLDSIRRQMRERERSMSREFDAFCMDKGFSTNFAGDSEEQDVMMADDPYLMRGSTRRGGGGAIMSPGAVGGTGYGLGARRPVGHLSSHGRSLTQNDFQLPPSMAGRMSTPVRRIREDGDLMGTAEAGMGYGRYGAGGGAGGGGGSLDLRERGDWRRVSVPERGQDFKSLPRKYNRMKTFCHLPTSASTSPASSLPFSSSLARSDLLSASPRHQSSDHSSLYRVGSYTTLPRRSSVGGRRLSLGSAAMAAATPTPWVASSSTAARGADGDNSSSSNNGSIPPPSR